MFVIYCYEYGINSDTINCWLDTKDGADGADGDGDGDVDVDVDVV